MSIRIRKLTQDEAASAFPRRGQMDLSEYVQALGSLQPGDAAAMDLGRLTIRAAKRRLGQAAGQLGWRLRWANATDGNVIYFQVLAGSGRGTGSTSEPEARPRRGRPRAQR